jgi:phosphotriesterase-related protein
MPVNQLGTTLFHEHLFLSNRRAYRPHPDPRLAYLAEKPVSMEDLALIREYPYACLDNLELSDGETLVWEVGQFQHKGGRSLVEVSGWNCGRDPARLRQLSLRTGLNIIMGCGLYRQASFPEWAIEADEVKIAEKMVQEVQEGIPLDGDLLVHPGILGEIGIEKGFSQANHKALRAAARAQTLTGVPLTVHLPGWERYGHEVVDICEACGVNPGAIVLDHMDPSSGDPQYQAELARRGVSLEFDMIGMGLYLYQEKQSPCDQEIARAILGLLDAGFSEQILLSQDVYLKIQWRSFGGNGYAHVLRSFLPRLKVLGVSDEACRLLVIDNPQKVFTRAAGVQINKL